MTVVTLGYLNIPYLKKLAHYVTGFDLDTSSLDASKFCEPCVFAKHTRISSRHAITRVNAPFRRIHADFSGGGKTLPLLGGKHYFMVLTDDFTRYRWVFFLTKKSDAFASLTSFMAMVKTQFNTTIACFRLDGGGEFNSHKFHAFLSQNGIKYKVSAPDTHAQNGVAKQANQYIGAKICALLMASILPKYL